MIQSKRVRDFNRQVGEALPALPTMLDRGEDPRTVEYYGEKLAIISANMKMSYGAGYGGLVTFRAALVLEELAELLQATTIEDQVDAVADAKVYLDGSAAFMGVDIDPMESIVMDGNEAKIWPDGTIHRDERGKWIKPPGWEENHAPEPRIREEIKLQQLEAAIEAGEYIMGVDLTGECSGKCSLCEDCNTGGGAFEGCEEPSE